MYQLASQLKEPSLFCEKAYVDGSWINAKSGSSFDVISACLQYSTWILLTQRRPSDIGSHRNMPGDVGACFPKDFEQD